MKRLKIILQSKKILFIILLFIIVFSFIRFNFKKYTDYSNVYSLDGILIDYKIDGDKLTFIIKSKDKIKCTYYIKTEEELKKYKNLKLGIKLKISGIFSKPNNNTIFNTFNYKKYLSYNGIYYICNVDNIIITNTKINLYYKIKNSVIFYVNTFKSKSYLKAFILNEKDDLDKEIVDTYQELGISHIFTVSGMHISLLSVILLSLLKRLKNRTKYSIVISFLLFYLILTSFSPSIFRSIIFFILLYINKEYDFNLDLINIYYLTISIILLIKPSYLLLSSFLYSSIVSFSIITFNKYINGNYFISLLKVSFLAYLFSLPITININYEINILTIFYNILFVPLITFVVYPLSLLVLIIKPLDIILFIIINFIELISNNIIVFNIIIPKLNIITIIFYYLFTFLFFYLMKKRYLLIIILIITINIIYPKLDNSLYVYYLDVGQGDSIVLKYKNKTFMIDTGGKLEYTSEEWNKKTKYYKTDNTIKFLKSIGISKINYLILTHGDTDHMGESIHLINNFKVDNVIFNCGEYNDLENELINLLEIKNIKYYSCIKELNLSKYKLQFLNTTLYDNENDNSNVIYLNINNYKFLFMGDASITREKEILNKYNLPNIDVLKVGHHGSKTSSSKEFINEINPNYSVISVGKKNRYGHPNKEVLDVLSNSKIYRTDEDGSIMFKIKNNKLKIETCEP